MKIKPATPTSSNTHAGFPTPGEAGFSGGAEGSQGSVLNQLLVQPEGERSRFLNRVFLNGSCTRSRLFASSLFLVPWADGPTGASGFVVPKPEAPFWEWPGGAMGGADHREL